MNYKKNSKQLTNEQLAEIKKYIKRIKEGSTTAGVGAYQTPKAFSGNEDGEGAEDIKRISHATAYEIPAKKTRKHSIDLHEVSYKDFKDDATRSTVQKVNESIIEINRKLREITRLISHSQKLKTEASLDDSKLWKRTNEALVKIADRMSEVAMKTKKFANIKEIQTNMGIENTFKAAGLKTRITKDSDGIHVDVDHFGEPVGFDIEGTKVLDDTGNVVGDLNDSDIVAKLKDYFNQ